MIDNQAIIEKQLTLESRLTRVEASSVYIHDELKDIKNNIRWLIGLIFTLNSAILGFVVKGFGLLG